MSRSRNAGSYDVLIYIYINDNIECIYEVFYHCWRSIFIIAVIADSLQVFLRCDQRVSATKTSMLVIRKKFGKNPNCHH